MARRQRQIGQQRLSLLREGECPWTEARPEAAEEVEGEWCHRRSLGGGDYSIGAPGLAMIVAAVHALFRPH
jgi:hypothetical protein